MRVSDLILLIAIVTFGSELASAKRYTRCGLEHELTNLKFDRSFIGNWICLIETESAKNTSLVTPKANGSTNFGLFQISNKDWCKQGSAGGRCNVKCEDLIDEDISNDAACAKKIQSEEGFKAWEGWVRTCKGRPNKLPPC